MSIDSKDKDFIKNILINDEGLKLFPYVDCCSQHWKKCGCKNKGDLTIGVGRNLDKYGITEAEAIYLLDNNIQDSVTQIERNFGSWFSKLNSPRKMVIISMAFNMGVNGLKTFQKMIKSIQSGDFNSAANQMMMSTWSSQVKKRAVILSEIMKSGILN